MSLHQDTYKYYCITEGSYIKETVTAGDSAPTSCKNDGGHTIDSNSVALYFKALRNTDIGLSNVENIKNNLSASAAPTSTNDDSEGYTVGSLWVDTTNDVQYICVDATNDAAVWNSSLGETNTGSNIGVGGIGVYKQKNGTALEFKNINAGSSRVSVSDDTGDNEIDIDVSEGNININNLSGAPTGDVVGTSDAQVLTNKTLADNSDNSKKVQFELSGLSTSTTRTITVPDSDLTMGDMTGPNSSTDHALVRYDGTSGKLVQDSGVSIDDSNNVSGMGYLELDDILEPSNPGSSKGRLYKKTGDDGLFWKPDAVGAEVDLTTGSGSNGDYFDGYDDQGGSLTSTFADVLLTVERQKTSGFTHVASSAEVICAAAGTYMIVAQVHFSVGSNDEGEMQLLLDTGSGYQTVDGSVISAGMGYSNFNSTPVATFQSIFSLSVGDKIKMQGRDAYGTVGLVAGGSSLSIYSIGTSGTDGAMGPTGPTGAGSNITVKDEGIDVTNTPHTSLNFVGTGVTVTDGGSGVATVTIASGEGGGTLKYIDVYSTSTNTFASSYIDVPLNVERHKDSDFTHAANSAEITVNTTDTYEIIMRISVDVASSSRTSSISRLMLDTGSGYAEVAGSFAYGYHRTTSQGESTMFSSIILALDSGDKVKMQVKREDGSGTLQLISGASGISIKKLTL